MSWQNTQIDSEKSTKIFLTTRQYRFLRVDLSIKWNTATLPLHHSLGEIPPVGVTPPLALDQNYGGGDRVQKVSLFSPSFPQLSVDVASTKL